MYKYEMDPTRTVGATERTQGGRTDRQTDWQTDGSETNIPPNNFVVRGYNEVKFQLMRSTVVFCETQLSACICAEMQGSAQDKDQDLSESIMALYLFNMQIYNAVTQSKGGHWDRTFFHCQTTVNVLLHKDQGYGMWVTTTLQWNLNYDATTFRITQCNLSYGHHNIQYYTTMSSELWSPQHSVLHNNGIWAMVATTFRITQQWNLSYGGHNIQYYTTMESELWSPQHSASHHNGIWAMVATTFRITQQCNLSCGGHNIQNYTTMESELWCHNIQYYTTMESELWWPQHSELHNNGIWAMVATIFRITQQWNLSYGGTTFSITQQWNLSYGGHSSITV